MTIMSERQEVEKKNNVLAVLKLLFPNYKVIFTPRAVLLKCNEENIMIDENNFEDLQEVQMGYFLSINTPFGNTKEPVYVKSYTDNSQIKYGVFNASNERLCNDVSNITQEDLNRIFEREADYTWMKFVRNTLMK